MKKHEYLENITNSIVNDDFKRVLSKLPDNCINCVYVDVPYEFEMVVGGGYSELAKRITNHRNELDFISHGFDYEVFIKECFRVMIGVNLFIWCSENEIYKLTKEIKKYTNAKIHYLVWCKSNPVPATNGTWLSDIEYCLCVRENTTKLNDGYHLKSKHYFSKINQDDKKKFKHPTIKPLELVERHLKHATNENDIVLDCFCGSGTTCVASKNTKRRYIGVELNKEYFDIAVNRINGIQANGQMFFDV